MTAVNSASANAAACTFRLLIQRCRQLLDIFQAADCVAHGVDSHVFFVLVVDVLAL